jgi:hypothetical protein
MGHFGLMQRGKTTCAVARLLDLVGAGSSVGGTSIEAKRLGGLVIDHER